MRTGSVQFKCTIYHLHALLMAFYTITPFIKSSTLLQFITDICKCGTVVSTTQCFQSDPSSRS